MFAWETALIAESWPAHPTTGRTPVPTLGDTDPTLGDEAVIVVVGDNESSMEWARLSKPGRTENFTLRCVIRSNVRGEDSPRTVLERLEALADVVQESVFDTTTTGQPVVSLGFDGERYAEVRGVSPAVVPGDDGSWLGECVVEVNFTADL